MAQFRRNVRSPSSKGGSVCVEFFENHPIFNPKIPLQRVAQFQRNWWLSFSGICIVVYFKTENIDETLKLATSNYGKIQYPKTDNGIGFVAEFEDTEKNRIALYQSR